MSEQANTTSTSSSTTSVPSPTKRSSVYRPLTSPKRRQTRSTASLATRTNTPTSPAVNTRQMRTDRLGTLVSELTAALDASPTWESFVSSFRGRSYLSPELEQVDHPAIKLLCEWRETGVPVRTESEPWTAKTLDALVERGWLPSLRHGAFHLPPRRDVRVHREQVLDCPAVRPGASHSSPATFPGSRQRRT